MLTKLVKATALEAAKQMIADPDFDFVWTHTDIDGHSPDCGLFLRDGQSIPALVCALDILGNYTVVLRDGGTRQYLSDEVA